MRTYFDIIKTSMHGHSQHHSKHRKIKNISTKHQEQDKNVQAILVY